MRVSVLIALYRAQPDYLRTQLDSIREQTRQPDEVILSDDASGDHTADAVTQYIQQYNLPWTLLRAEENSGYIRNFQKLIRASSGDYLSFCDQDDRWHPDKLARMEQALQGLPHAGGIACAFNQIDAHGQPLPDTTSARGRVNHGLYPRRVPMDALDKLDSFHTHDMPLLLSNRCLGCCTMIARRAAWLYLSLSPDTLPHDWALNLAADAMGGLYFLNTPLMDYRLHDHNVIGLRRDRASIKTGSNENARLSLAREGAHGVDYIRALCEKTGQACPVRLCRYMKNRLAAVEERKLSRMMTLYRDYPLYRRQFSLRQRLGDWWMVMRPSR